MISKTPWFLHVLMEGEAALLHVACLFIKTHCAEAHEYASMNPKTSKSLCLSYSGDTPFSAAANIGVMIGRPRLRLHPVILAPTISFIAPRKQMNRSGLFPSPYGYIFQRCGEATEGSCGKVCVQVKPASRCLTVYGYQTRLGRVPSRQGGPISPATPLLKAISCRSRSPYFPSLTYTTV